MAGAIAALRNFKNEINAVGTALEGDRAGLGQLMHSAASDKNPAAARARYMGEAKRIYGTGATTSLGQAGELVFALEQAGLNPSQRDKMARALRSGVLPEARTTTTAIAALRTAFPHLSPDQALGMGIYAGIASPGGADVLVQGAAKSAQQLKTLGWGPEVGLAATSLLTKAYPGQGEAATRLEQFTKQLERFGLQEDSSLRGMGPLETLDRIGARTKGGTDRPMLEKYLGNRSEAIQGFRSLYQMRSELGQLIGGTALAGGGFVDRAIGLAETTPEIGATTAKVGARNRRALSRLGPVTTSSLLESTRDDLAGGRGAFMTGMYDFDSWARSFFPEWLKQINLRQMRNHPGLEGDTQEQIRLHLQNLDRKAKTAPPASGVQE